MGHTSGQRFICTPYLHIWLLVETRMPAKPQNRFKNSRYSDVIWFGRSSPKTCFNRFWSIAISGPICAARLLELWDKAGTMRRHCGNALAQACATQPTSTQHGAACCFLPKTVCSSKRLEDKLGDILESFEKACCIELTASIDMPSGHKRRKWCRVEVICCLALTIRGRRPATWLILPIEILGTTAIHSTTLCRMCRMN